MQISVNNQFINLKPGDRVLSPITIFGLSKHHAIFYGYYHGIPHFIENKVGIGVRLVHASIFLAQNSIQSVIPFYGTNYQRNQMLQFAYSKIGTNYDIVNYNCEHFANEIQNNSRYSQQALNVGIFVGLFLIGCLIANID